ncbi:serine hydrolase [Salinicoccus halitifaciens]|uniref:Beta-lactamase class A n=1 Tax=Salinicoccus halitifaciens TaxID=1073415 RepID=A0ABV2EB45_9STAP|nr:serine hydrolase [Salinicoccus halitifaciens]MCD2137523.1 class A beta-lactamase-related serine hydrolase [Salinicoccus halitifaciens]
MMKEEIDMLVRQQSTKNISYVIEHEGEVIRHRENKVHRSASVIKIPLCLAALKKAHDVDRDDLLLVKKKVGGSGVLHALNDVEVIPLKDTVVLAMIVSDNTASNMLMDYVGFKNLEKSFREWGINDSVLGRHFMDTSGDASKISNTATAEDMMTALHLIYEENKFIPEPVRQDMQKHMRNSQFNDRVGGALNDGGDEDHITVSNKTGTLDNLEHDIGVLQSKDKTVKFSVLSSDWNSNLEARYFLNDLGKTLIKYFQ